MKLRAWHLYAGLLAVGTLGILIAWHWAGDSTARNVAGGTDHDATGVVAPAIPAAKTSVANLSRALFERWRFNASISPLLEQREIALSSSSVSPRKALQALGDELDLPVALPPPEEDGGTSVHVGIGGVIWGKKNDNLERAMIGLVSSPPERQADFVHALAGVDDNRVESVVLWALNNSKEASVRGAAAFELASASSPDAHQALVKSLSDEDEMVRDQARTAIEQIGGTTMEPLLRTAMQLANDDAAMEAGDLLERAFGLEVPTEFWVRFTSK